MTAGGHLVFPELFEAVPRSIFVSDGGHFENLALYETVRRRCKTVVVLDGGCDEALTYEDLGNALRTVRIDLGIPIEFDPESLAALPVCGRAHPVCGRLGRTDSLFEADARGEELPDVTSYQVSHPSFPHESTDNQWFAEAQTESYRMMGLHTVRDVLGNWEGETLEDALEYLEQRGK